jgi:hypothetical protein
MKEFYYPNFILSNLIILKITLNFSVNFFRFLSFFHFSFLKILIMSKFRFLFLNFKNLNP